MHATQRSVVVISSDDGRSKHARTRVGGSAGERDRSDRIGSAYPLGEAVGEGGVAAPVDAAVGGELPGPLRLKELQALVERAGVVERRRRGGRRRRGEEEERRGYRQGGRRLGRRRHQPRHAAGSTSR
jgi:hypothetical protein